MIFIGFCVAFIAIMLVYTTIVAFRSGNRFLKWQSVIIDIFIVAMLISLWPNIVTVANAQSSRTYYRAPNGATIGSRMNNAVYDASGRRMGSFDPATQTTRDPSGKVVARGDMTAAFLICL